MPSDIVPALVGNGAESYYGGQVAPVGATVLAGGVAYDPYGTGSIEEDGGDRGCKLLTKEGNVCNGRGVQHGVCVGHRKAL